MASIPCATMTQLRWAHRRLSPGDVTPVPEKAGLDVLGPEGLVQQHVVAKVDLAHGEVVGGPPPTVERIDGITLERGRWAVCDLGHGAPRGSIVART